MRDAMAQFAEADTVPVGINFADAASHQAFIDAYDLPFDLLVDADMAVTRAYDALNAAGSGIRRTVVLVGKDGRVMYREQGSPPPGELLEIIARGGDEYSHAG